MDITTTQGMKQALTDKLRLGFGVTPEEADDAQVMRAAALVLRDVMTERGVESRMATRREEKRKVHYLSMEFLLGRSLEKNAYNLGVSGLGISHAPPISFQLSGSSTCCPSTIRWRKMPSS